MWTYCEGEIYFRIQEREIPVKEWLQFFLEEGF